VNASHTQGTLALSPADQVLLTALLARDEDAFAALVDRHSASMLRLAMVYTPSRAVAEEAVQEAWLVVIGSLDAFEGRSTLKTWIFGILANCARARGVRERRTVPFASLAGSELLVEQAAVDPSRFRPPGARHEPGHWTTPPRRRADSPEWSLDSSETSALVRKAVERLPAMQRVVIVMRDLEDWNPNEVCEALTISDAHQRVLLHRARANIRNTLERELDGDFA
jgi:RNA polymerase sigma-70 factor (ECF subfamily)